MRRISFATEPSEEAVTDVTGDVLGARQRILPMRSATGKLVNTEPPATGALVDAQPSASDQLRLAHERFSAVLDRVWEVMRLEAQGRYDEAAALNVRLKFELIHAFFDLVEKSGGSVQEQRNLLQDRGDKQEDAEVLEHPKLVNFNDRADAAMQRHRRKFPTQVLQLTGS